MFLGKLGYGLRPDRSLSLSYTVSKNHPFRFDDQILSLLFADKPLVIRIPPKDG
jgi:hypothetical protein